MASPATQGLAGWDFLNNHVQPAIAKDRFITFETQVLGFGPAELSDLAGASTGVVPETDARTIAVYPAGLVENFTFAGGQSVQKIFEIGSVRSYLIAGRPDATISFSRILFHGPSLMRSIYAAFKDRRGLFNSLVGNSAPGVQTIDVGRTAPGTVNAGGLPDHDFFFNMQNILFRQPFGALLFIKDTKNTPYSGIYFETCLPMAYGFGVSAGTVNVMESLNVAFDRALPVDLRFSSTDG